MRLPVRLLIGTIVLLIAFAGCASPMAWSPLARWEQSQVYAPLPYPGGDWEPIDLNYEDAWFRSDDGTSIHGWFVPHENPRAIALFCHGNAGNLSTRAETLRLLHERHQLAVMIFDYRGYGRSEGRPNEMGILQDARAARKWLAERTGVAEQDIVLMGRSLGGAVAVDLAADDGARGLVLASTFTTLPDVASNLMPLIPAQRLMVNRFDSLSKISNYRGPLLQSHGDADQLIPMELGWQLHEAAPGPKTFVTIPGGRHNDPQSEEYRLAFDEFIDSLPD